MIPSNSRLRRAERVSLVLSVAVMREEALHGRLSARSRFCGRGRRVVLRPDGFLPAQGAGAVSRRQVHGRWQLG